MEKDSLTCRVFSATMKQPRSPTMPMAVYSRVRLPWAALFCYPKQRTSRKLTPSHWEVHWLCQGRTLAGTLLPPQASEYRCPSDTPEPLAHQRDCASRRSPVRPRGIRSWTRATRRSRRSAFSRSRLLGLHPRG